MLQKLGLSLPDIRDVNVQRVQVSGRDAYHITFTANGKPYSFYVDTHDFSEQNQQDGLSNDRPSPLAHRFLAGRLIVRS